MPAPIQTANAETNSTSISCSLASLPTVGNSVIAVLTCRQPISISGMTDNQSGNTYHSVVTNSVPANGVDTEIWWLPAVVGASGTFTVTASLSGSGGPAELVLMEVPNLTGTDKTGTATAAGAPGTLTVTASAGNSQANDFVVAAFTSGYVTATTGTSNPASSGYTSAFFQDGTGSGYQSVAQVSYKTVTASETSSATWTGSSWNGVCACLATFTYTAATPATETIKAIAVVPGQIPSTVASAAYTISNPTSSAPAPAAAVGYTSNTFNSTLFNSTPGNLYNWNFYNNHIPAGGVIQNSDGSLTLNPLSSSLAYSGSVSCVAASTTNPKKWQGQVFGGGGYFEVTAKYTGTQSGDAVDPLFLFDILSSSGYLSETTQGYSGIEIDAFEMNVPGSTTQAGIAMHNYYYDTPSGGRGTANPAPIKNASPITIPSGSLNNNVNQYGVLWVPATATSQGALSFWFNRVQCGPTYNWPLYSASQPFPPAAPNIGNIIDTMQLHFVICTSNQSTPLTVYSVQVWQGATANNATWTG